MAENNDTEEQAISLIKELRNYRDAEKNWAAFDALVKNNIEDILSSFSTRWIISICDTYIDYGDEIESRNAMSISIFMNMLRFSETIKFVRPRVSAEHVQRANFKVVRLKNGLNTFAIQKQDVFLNLSRRFNRLLQKDELMKPIWEELLTRLHHSENVITDFSRGSAVMERYFPLDPSGLKDNYGL